VDSGPDTTADATIADGDATSAVDGGDADATACSASCSVTPVASPLAAGGAESLAINDQGEVLWLTGGGSNPMSITSSVRGSIATGNVAFPCINDKGDTAWQSQTTTTSPWQIVENGTPLTAVTSGFGAYDPVLLQSGEVLWTAPQEGVWSSTRGQVVTDPTVYQFAANNLGEVVYTTLANTPSPTQIFSTTRGTIATSTSGLGSPAINDSGEVVWIEGGPSPMVVHSSTRGVLATEESVLNLVINNAGDVAWIAYVGGTCNGAGTCSGGTEQTSVYRCGTVNRINPSLSALVLAMNDQGTVVFGAGVAVYEATCTSTTDGGAPGTDAGGSDASGPAPGALGGPCDFTTFGSTGCNVSSLVCSNAICAYVSGAQCTDDTQCAAGLSCVATECAAVVPKVCATVITNSTGICSIPGGHLGPPPPSITTLSQCGAGYVCLESLTGTWNTTVPGCGGVSSPCVPMDIPAGQACDYPPMSNTTRACAAGLSCQPTACDASFCGYSCQ
jgi:hypothetical protein